MVIDTIMKLNIKQDNSFSKQPLPLATKPVEKLANQILQCSLLKEHQNSREI